MQSLWIIAAAGDEVTSQEVTSESAAPSEQSGTATQDGSNGTQEPAPKPDMKDSLMSFLPLILIMVVMFFFMMRGPRKRQKEQEKMLKNLQKNDRVRTIGGILGTVIDINNEELTLKIDESNNTKMKIVAGAVAKVISREE